jgi:hypothetical protein
MAVAKEVAHKGKHDAEYLERNVPSRADDLV